MRRLYDRFSGYTMAIVLRYVHDRDDARDVLQDSFVRILTSIPAFDYRGEGSLKAWVSKIVMNRALDWLGEQEALLLTDEMPDVAEEAEEPDIGGVPPDVLNRMIGQLPVGCRVVLNLHVFEGLSHREIGRKFGIRESSSASQYSRAKRLLKEMIEEYLNSQRI